jgi:hypothetical protein
VLFFQEIRLVCGMIHSREIVRVGVWGVLEHGSYLRNYFFNKVTSFLPGNFNSFMHQSLYRLRQGSMAITKFKLKFDEYAAYFSSWTENDRIEFFVKYITPKGS